MTIIERYLTKYYSSTLYEDFRTGYHEWNGGKWLTNFVSFVRIGNPKLKVNPAKGPCFNFGAFVSSELDYRWRDQGSAFKYSSEGPKYKWYDALGMMVNNEMMADICKIAGAYEFTAIARNNHTVYLYTDKLEAMVLAYRKWV